ncbi:MAG: folate-binding protein [Burkholderiaceae bacterium]|nr:folate-binding protein [Burkholderiaceae bacterium]
MSSSSSLPAFAMKSWQLLSVHGADASSFLHSQLTQDVKGLASNQWRYAGYCNPKGRLYSTSLIWRMNPEHVFMMVPENNADFLLKRLSIFIMRSKVKVCPMGTEMLAIGLFDQAATALLNSNTLYAGEFCSLDENVFLLNCSSAQQNRCLIWAPADSLYLAKYAENAVTEAAWQASDILAGIAHVDAITREAFVPQMINFELLGGVNFKKGCYPGQEVVARSQYLGKLKRRLGIGKVMDAAPVLAMSDVYTANTEQPVGRVAAVASAENNRGWLLAYESPLSTQTAGSLHLADGRAISPLPLPYPLVDITAD